MEQQQPDLSSLDVGHVVTKMRFACAETELKLCCAHVQAINQQAHLQEYHITAMCLVLTRAQQIISDVLSMQQQQQQLQATGSMLSPPQPVQQQPVQQQPQQQQATDLPPPLTTPSPAPSHPSSPQKQSQQQQPIARSHGQEAILVSKQDLLAKDCGHVVANYQPARRAYNHYFWKHTLHCGVSVLCLLCKKTHMGSCATDQYVLAPLRRWATYCHETRARRGTHPLPFNVWRRNPTAPPYECMIPHTQDGVVAAITRAVNLSVAYRHWQTSVERNLAVHCPLCEKTHYSRCTEGIPKLTPQHYSYTRYASSKAPSVAGECTVVLTFDRWLEREERLSSTKRHMPSSKSPRLVKRQSR
jgi:hypothetical protein